MVIIIYIYDKKCLRGDFGNNGIGILDDCVKATISNNLNGEYSLEVSYPVESSKSSYLEELNIIKANNQLFRIYKVERSQDNNLTINVWARHIFYDLSYYFVESAKILNANLKEAIEQSIPPEVQSDYDILAFDSTVAPFALSRKNATEVIFALLEVYGGELYRDNFTIDFRKMVGADKGVHIRYGKNIKGFTLTIDSSVIASRIYPVGENDLLLPERYIEIKGDKPLPFDITKKVEFSNCGDIESLRTAAKEYAETSIVPKMNVSIDFVELSKTKEYERFKSLVSVSVGDLVTIYHEKLNVSVSLRVIHKQIDLLNPINTKIELGDPLDSIIEKIDSSKLLDEIKELINDGKTGLVMKTNSDVVTVTTTKIPVMVIGIATKADSNLTCTVTMTGKAITKTTLSILFSLDGKYYDLKPVQVLEVGDNVLGFSLHMPQVGAGSHSFTIEMVVSNDTFVIEKNNLQVAIEGLNIEGGLSATIPRIEVIFTYLYTLFYKKMTSFNYNESYDISREIYGETSTKELISFKEFRECFENYTSLSPDMLVAMPKEILGIVEMLSRLNSLNYKYDMQWIDWDSDFDKLSDGTYESYDRVTIKEPVYTNSGRKIEIETGELSNFVTLPEYIGDGESETDIDIGANTPMGVVYEVAIMDKALYKDLVTINVSLVEEMEE